MTSRRSLILCAALSFIVATGCGDSGSNDENLDTGNDTTVSDNGTPADTAAPVDAAVDAGEVPEEDVTVADTATVEDTTVTEDTAPVEDVTIPEDTTTTEDAAVVVFDDGFTVPAEGLAGCDNKDDIMLLSGEQAELTETMKKCALNCLGEEVCATDCVIKEMGVTDECAACFGASIACTMKNCALHCMDPNNDKCAECQEENCNDDFNECAGLVIPGT